MVKFPLTTVSRRRAARFQSKLDERGAHEFLFANRVIFVEGKDDRYAMTLGLEKLDVDLDGLGVSVVAVGGVESLPDFARIASSLNVPWCAVPW